MRKKNKKLFSRLFMIFLSISILVLLPERKAKAEGSMFDSPYVVPYYHMDVDGSWKGYFTISQPLPIDQNRGETVYVCHTYEEYRQTGTSPSYWLSEGTTVETGIQSTLRALMVGEHYYDVKRTGEIPIGKWVVRHRGSSCVHTGSQKGEWMGLAVGVRAGS